MSMAIIVAAVLCGVGLIAALQVLARAARLLSLEPRLRSLSLGTRPSKAGRPPELLQLETLVADSLRGDRAALRRLSARLAAVGVALPPDATPQAVVDAFERVRAGPGR